MICPACKTGVRFEVSGSSQVYDDLAGSGPQFGYDVAHGFCPECSQFIVLLRRGRYYQADLNESGSRELMPPMTVQIIYPGPGSRLVEPEVPDTFAKEFGEACTTLAVSPKASAALSRRLLQRVLREKLGIHRNSLVGEIEDFIGGPGVPSHLAEAVDAVRNIGNFAAHPLKDQHTGEVVDVEPGEADWLLDALERRVKDRFRKLHSAVLCARVIGSKARRKKKKNTLERSRNFSYHITGGIKQSLAYVRTRESPDHAEAIRGRQYPRCRSHT